MNRRQRAFTLVEVMIAITLLLIVGTAVLRTMTLTFGTKTKMSNLNDRFHEGRQVTQRIAKELRMAYLRSDLPDPFQEEQPSVVTRFKGEEDEIFFATTAHLRMQAGARESDQAEVSYFLKRGDRDNDYEGRTLYRRESRRVDDDPERGGAIWPVVEGVKEFRLEYWDDAKEIGDDAWESSWDSDDNKLLPARVRITLELEQTGGGRTIRFQTQAAPKIRRPIDPLNRANQRTGAGNQAGSRIDPFGNNQGNAINPNNPGGGPPPNLNLGGGRK